MADANKLYPQATPAGESIPTEIVRPLGLIRQAVAVAVSAAHNLPATAGFLVLKSNVECLISLGGIVAVPADGAHTVGLIHLYADEVLVIDHDSAANFTVISADGVSTGVLWIQTIDKYKDIRKSAQYAKA